MDKVKMCALLLLVGCSSPDEKKMCAVEPITRHHDDHLFDIPESSHVPHDAYPWEAAFVGDHPRITKEYFYCNGSHLNPLRDNLTDCGGMSEHGLPYIDGEEGVHTVLIDLLNHIQEKTKKRVVITCGHRCPQHNAYAEPENNTSKHMVGSEVDFYVQGLEEDPEAIIAILQSYFEKPFQRFHKETDVSTPPWYNNQVFIKIFKSDEGRDLDNRHPYPYLSIQVKGTDAAYTWRRAHREYRRV